VPFGAEFATRLAARRDQLTAQGTLLPGAAEALTAVAGLNGVVQSVLTGSSRPNAALKLRAFGLDRYLDLAIGGFAGSEPYPMGALLRATRLRAEEKYKVSFAERCRSRWPAAARPAPSSATPARTWSSPTSPTPRP
jgi:phosphoglycolate phosphatase-like HAD superfamily hydrolase